MNLKIDENHSDADEGLQSVIRFCEIETQQRLENDSNKINHPTVGLQRNKGVESRVDASTSTFRKDLAPRILQKRCIFTERKAQQHKASGCVKNKFQGKEPPSQAKMASIVPNATAAQRKVTEKYEYQNAEAAQAKLYRAKVLEAYRNRRIFTVFGNYGTIRRALLKRGWLEKLSPNRYAKLQNLPEEVLLQHAKHGNEYETVAISKVINHFPAFFVWQSKGQRDLYADVKPYRNRIHHNPMMDFSTKVGLIGCAEQQQWFGQEGVASMLYPRFFRLGGSLEEQMEFIDEFRVTQCRSLLRYLTKNADKPEAIIDYENGSVSNSVVHFAIAMTRMQMDEWNNISSLDTEQAQIPAQEWNDFITNSSKIINLSHKLKCTYRELSEFTRTAAMLLAKLEHRRPDYKWDGFKNLWILKPGYQSRGLGIIIRNNLDDILRWSSSHTNRQYIVQKYIEQPLLIYNTKFDIRQYMLVSIRESTVQIWLYKECYLRFSSQEYNIDDLREVIHLTNNSVQKKYKTKSSRDARLPMNNMWSGEQFKVYMKSENLAEDLWERRVFAGFRENLIAVVMASLDETTMCENCFELYGCDFMLDENYNPILIEINSTPDLSASTDVTARLCPMVMEDCIKVVVDRPRNARALTGLFQMVYEVNYKFEQDNDAVAALNVSGKSMELCERARRPAKVKSIKKIKKKETASNQSTRTTRHHKLSPPVQLKKSTKIENGLAVNVGQTLKALALRYTMPL